MARVHQLGFEQRQVYVRWALDRASFARQTIAQRRVELFAPKRIIVKTELERGPDRIRPAAGGHVFLARREECRAHRRRVFSAAAAPVALLQVADERFILEGKRERRLEWQPQARFGFYPQVIIDLESAVTENFPGIEKVFRIEEVLNLPHYAEQLVAHLLRHVFGARHADAVLGRERSFELPNEC